MVMLSFGAVGIDVVMLLPPLPRTAPHTKDASGRRNSRKLFGGFRLHGRTVREWSRWLRRGSVAMSDKSPRHAMSKKSTKSIKEKRRDKRAAQAPASQVDKVMHPKRG